jgi:hypothetical protein
MHRLHLIIVVAAVFVLLSQLSSAAEIQIEHFEIDGVANCNSH